MRLETLLAVDGRLISRATQWFAADRVPGLAGRFSDTGSIIAALMASGIADYVRASTTVGAQHATAACELLTPGGCWSSYPPHKHDERRPGLESELEEIYYYEVARGGMAYQRVYGTTDVLEEVRTGDIVDVPHGWHGPAIAAPGYDLYYLNVMAGPGATRESDLLRRSPTCLDKGKVVEPAVGSETVYDIGFRSGPALVMNVPVITEILPASELPAPLGLDIKQLHGVPNHLVLVEYRQVWLSSGGGDGSKFSDHPDRVIVFDHD